MEHTFGLVLVLWQGVDVSQADAGRKIECDEAVQSCHIRVDRDLQHSHWIRYCSDEEMVSNGNMRRIILGLRESFNDALWIHEQIRMMTRTTAELNKKTETMKRRTTSRKGP